MADSVNNDVGAIAVVGMAGRFPGANDVDTFWDNLTRGVESVQRFDLDELDIPPDPTSPDATDTFIAAKGIMDDIDKFDARFFGYLPREAALMDPQHRVFLETCYEALEHAGCDPFRFAGNVGVYAGCYIDTYLLANLCSDVEFLRNLVKSIQVGTLQCELGNDKDYLATRVAFKLNLRGPAVTLQTACSTSLVALSHACQGLQAYQCDAALAGGVTITLPLKRGYYYKKGGMLSGDGHCRAFDENAAGTVFSNASAALVLKRLEDALADGDTVYAVIRGHACNNDGAQKLSYTAPSVDGQAEVIALAHAIGDIDARTVGYIEAHGTATPLGDPIEIQGLTKAFRLTTEDTNFCAVGSVKTNIGHLDCASGAVGTIKTALCLHHKQLVPSLNFVRPNPNIDFANSPFYVNTELKEFPSPDGGRRRAGVSSFGVGGTNAHLVLEEAPEVDRDPGTQRAQHLLLVSAKTETAMNSSAERLAAHLATHPEQNLADVAYTLQAGRAVYAQRRIVVAGSHDEAIEKLNKAAPPPDRAKSDGAPPPVVFMFPGQGSQFPGMARDLYANEPVFAEHFNQCSELLTPTLGRDLRDLVFKFKDQEEAAAALRQTEVAQPAIFAIEYSLAKLWMSWGVQPAAFIGHSVGEFAAAALAGVFELEDALRIVTVRGKLMQELPTGSMLSVRAPVQEVERMLGDGLCLAASNAPSLTVVSGPSDGIKALQARLDAAEIPHTFLHTSHAFHSDMMDPAVAPTVAEVQKVSLGAPQVPIMSTVTGAWLSDDEAADPAYWGRNLRQPVRFSEGITALADEDRLYLEVGPGQVLSTLARQTIGKTPQPITFSSLAHARQKGADLPTLMSTVGRLWLHGVQLDWRGFHGGEPTRVPLPTYPFERKRHWVEPGNFEGVAADGASSNKPQSSATNRDGVEKVIQQQMAVIAQQLAILRGGRS